MPNTAPQSVSTWWTRLLAADANRSSHAEKWIATAGGFAGIFGILWLSSQLLDATGAVLIVASMGATAVLLFAVPHSALAQPWNVLGGHLISAAIGVSCAQFISEPLIAAPLAVGLAIGAMYYLHCIHPPGGATALVAVMGGDAITALGYLYIVNPVMVNVLIILAVAVMVNLPFHWRRYPAGLSINEDKLPPGEKTMIAHSDLVYALSQLDSFIDVSEQDLVRIYNLAVHHHDHQPKPPRQTKKKFSGETDTLYRELQS
jgi:CBS-domain-containing membrane protein